MVWNFSGVLLVLLQASCTDSEVYKFDVTTFDPSPLVGTNSAEEYRAYLAWDYRDATFDKIGRYEDTGTGEVGSGYENPQDEAIVPSGSGFPFNTRTYINQPPDKHRRLEVNIPKSSSNDRIGVFYSTLTSDGDTLSIPTIKMSAAAAIRPLKYTSTASIGDTVDLMVTTTKTNLRWTHDNGGAITEWTNKQSVTITNVRLADAGIYECYEAGQRETGQHAIMRLIVRECPGPKYGDACSNTCNTCWNGGVCAADDGTCLCQPGFAGPLCSTRCTDKGESNNWGASCSLFCSGGTGNCGGNLICGPDPIGCACVNGYSGLDCETSCPAGMYGANCERECHCSNLSCNPARGCTTSSNCNTGYSENYCQGRDTCDQGFFGAECEFHCHCDQGDGCNKETGECSNDGCDDGWAGTDCQQALPAMTSPHPTITSIDGVTIEVDWEDWNQMVDFGNGPVSGYRLFYGSQGALTSFEDVTYSNASISGLQTETTYHFAVAVLRSVDGDILAGKLGGKVNGETQCLGPTDHPNFTDVTVLSTDSIRLEWEIPTGTDWYQCSTLKDFLITYTETGTTFTEAINVPLSNLTTIVKPLKPCTLYSFQIQATNRYKDGLLSPPESATTDVIAPGRVESLAVRPSPVASITVEWKAPNKSECDITVFGVNYTLTSLDQCDDSYETKSTQTTETNITLTNLEYFSTYEISVWARSGDEYGPANEDTVVTEETVPSGSPTNLLVYSDGTNVLSYTWTLPECTKRGGEVVYEYKFGKNINNGQFTQGSTENTSISFFELLYYSNYEFQIRANTSEGAGPYTAIDLSRTPEGAPDAPTNLQVLNEFTESIEVQWNIPETINGELIRYMLDIFNMDLQSRKVIDITDDLLIPTIAINVTDLIPKTPYLFKVKAETNGGEGPWSLAINGTTTPYKSTDPQALTTIIAAVVSVSFIIVLIAIIVGTLFLRKRRQDENDKSFDMDKENSRFPGIASDNTSGSPHVNVAFKGDLAGESSDADTDQAFNASRNKPKAKVKPTIGAKPMIVKHEPVKIEDLFDFVRRKKINAPDHEFSRDYESLPGNQMGTCKESKGGSNLAKNRYKNIITYDHSRVVLDLMDGKPNSDYINASYIDGYQKQKAYIAAQGPKSKTINDMWRMIWQEQSHTIVMATNLVEGGKTKSEQYWPNVGHAQSYGDIYVSNKEAEQKDDFVVRHLHVSKTDTYVNVKEAATENTRYIKQFHFTTWPDMGVPDNVRPILTLIEDMNKANSEDAGPIVIHCSAGVGRTGSIIAIDTMLKMARSESKVDVYNFVREMRKNRVFMVQAEPQYVFIHDAILEALFCRQTVITTQEFEQTWNDMSRSDNTMLHDQYQTLRSTYPPLASSKCAGGNKPENIDKNRYKDIIPPDVSRPYLMTGDDDDEARTNYINAAFCHGFQRDSLYAAAQAPLPDTVSDLWRMVYDYKCYIIVDLTSETAHPDKAEVRVIKQYQYMDWIENTDLPNSPESFLQLIAKVEIGMTQTKTDVIKDHRIAVVCLDGVKRCGVFCAVKSVIDEIKKEGQLDVFQTVKQLKKSRHEMVNSQEQFVFCYEAAWSHLKSYATYANFSN